MSGSTPGRLAGNVAIVTGSARGIGYAIAERLLADGADVVVADIAADPAATAAGSLGAAAGRDVQSVVVDIGDEASTAAMAAAVVERHGCIDVLVNNAGLMAGIARRPFDEIPVDEWDRVMAVNVRGTWNAAKAVTPTMRAQGSGHIVNVASDTTLSGVPGLAHYVASKGAIDALTRVLARELGTHGIAVNAVAPGFTITDAALDEGGDARERSVAARALHRDVTPAEIAGVVAFLASADAELLTGQIVVANAGYVFR